MRWDVLRPWRTFSDRFVLSAGHTVPLVYAILATLNEGMRARHALDGDERFAFPDDGRWALTWEDLLTFRHRGGLPGHAEMAGKTLLFKANTGPSGHGMPVAAGEALALKMAGCPEVKVFVVEGEGGLTPGVTHETLNSAWGLGLGNLVFLVDWNDFGIDPRAASTVVHGTPEDWFGSHGWRTLGTPEGMAWEPVLRTALEAARGDNPASLPTMAWFRTQKGRGYGKQDAASHGIPHALNSPAFWAAREGFQARYGVTYEGAGEAAPADAAARQAQAAANLQLALSVLTRDEATVRWLSDRLAELAAAVPDAIPGCTLGGGTAAIFSDPVITDFRSYPAELYKAPGEMQPNRAALGTWGAGSTPTPSGATGGRSSWPAPRTSPNPPTSPASPRTSASCPAGAGTSATPTRAGRSCPRRSRRWPTPASWPAWPRSASRRMHAKASTASGAPAPPTPRSRT